MPRYFMLHDAKRFHALIRPALAASRRQRSFAPCVSLLSALRDDIERFVTENCIRREDLMIFNAQPNLPFDRETWRMITGEVLLAAAAEVPEIPDVEGALVSLFGDNPSIHDAYHGTLCLCFGPGWYRPDHAGYNDIDDAQRLANYMASINPNCWDEAEMILAGQSCKEEDREQMAFARQAFELLSAVYGRARTGGQLIICESIE